MPDTTRLSINQITTRDQWSLREAIQGYARHGVRAICVWRDKLADCGIDDAVRLLDDHGMTVTGLCRGGLFTALTQAERLAALDDNRRAIDEAKAIGAACLVLVVGGMPQASRDIAEARKQARDGIATTLAYAREVGVPLAVEPLHPMQVERACINTMAQANDLCDELGEGLGIAVDVYHVWWDPNLEAEIDRATGTHPRISCLRLAGADDRHPLGPRHDGRWCDRYPGDPAMGRARRLRRVQRG